MKTIRRSFLLLAFLLLCSPISRATNFQTLLPRPPALPGNAYRLPEKTEIGRIVIKFQEGTHVRLRNQRLVMLERNDRERAEMASRGLDLARPQTATSNTIQSFRSHSVPIPEPRSARRRSL